MRPVPLVLALALLAAPLAADAQQAGKVARIGIFESGTTDMRHGRLAGII